MKMGIINFLLKIKFKQTETVLENRIVTKVQQHNTGQDNEFMVATVTYDLKTSSLDLVLYRQETQVYNSTGFLSRIPGELKTIVHNHVNPHYNRLYYQIQNGLKTQERMNFIYRQMPNEENKLLDIPLS